MDDILSLHTLSTAIFSIVCELVTQVYGTFAKNIPWAMLLVLDLDWGMITCTGPKVTPHTLYKKKHSVHNVCNLRFSVLPVRACFVTHLIDSIVA